MPELPEVETVCRGLAPLFEGNRFARVTLRRRDLRIPFPKGLAQRLQGRRIERVFRRAKYMVVTLDGGDALIAHLGMSGSMTVVKGDRPLDRHDHVIFMLENGTEVRFNDPRRFGLLTMTRTDALDRHKLFAHLGPDPLDPVFTPEFLSAALKGRKTSIKAALLDQRLVVGVGNIYACESLHRAGISPKRKAGTVAGPRSERLVPAIRAVLEQAIAAGGSSLRDHVQPSGELGYFQDSWSVYGREGEACSCAGCKGVIKRIVQAGRSSFYCPVCQR